LIRGSKHWSYDMVSPTWDRRVSWPGWLSKSQNNTVYMLFRSPVCLSVTSDKFRFYAVLDRK